MIHSESARSAPIGARAGSGSREAQLRACRTRDLPCHPCDQPRLVGRHARRAPAHTADMARALRECSQLGLFCLISSEPMHGPSADHENWRVVTWMDSMVIDIL